MGQDTRPELRELRLSLPQTRTTQVSIALGTGGVARVDPATWRWDLSELRPEDIAYGLSNICRFTGGPKRYYSVAEHSVIGYRMTGEPWWLLHDAHEMLGFGDVNSRLKEFMAFDLYRAACAATDAQISEYLLIPMTDVHKLDKALGNYEAKVLTGIHVPLNFYDMPYLPEIHCWTPVTAREEWMECYRRIK